MERNSAEGQPTVEGGISPSSGLLQGKSDPVILESGSTNSKGQGIGDSTTTAQSWSLGAVFFTGIVPLAALIVWLATRTDKSTFNTFAGEAIGGRLSQSQAKAVDVVCGAILAPLVMASVNVLWFSSARVSAVNEQQKKSIPLRSLVTASGICSGSFDFLTTRDLLQGKTWRLFLLSIVVLLSALTRTALANIIAYEAYTTTTSFIDSWNLRMQRDAAVESTYRNNRLLVGNIPGLDLYDFTATQQADIAKEITALFTEMAFANASSRLTDGTYIGGNATAASLDALPLTVLSLNKVPAYRLSVNCTPRLAEQISILQPYGQYHSVTQISILWNETGTTALGPRQANYPGTPSDISTGDGDDYSFVGFTLGSEEAYLGRLNRFNLTNDTAPSPYGAVHYAAFNMSQWGFTGTQSTMSTSGLSCALYRETGTLDYVRGSGNTSTSSSSSSSSSWTITNPTFDPTTKTRIPSLLAQWQTNLNYRAPSANNPGIGPALCSRGSTYYDNAFGDYALNFLYASGEVQRLTYEVAASDTANATRNAAEYFYPLSGTETEQHYRITYVPSILLVGLISMLGAAGVTGAMALFAWRSVSGGAFRRVDPVRLLVDGVVGLRGSVEEVARVAGGSNTVVDEWAGRCRVRYSVVEEGVGEPVRVVLEKR